MGVVLDHVAQLERDLLTAAVRADRARLEDLLHPDFVEIGASGRRWTRGDMIAALLASPDPGDVTAQDLAASAVGDDVVLVTYSTHRDASAVHRSSLWVRHDGRWVVRYHQGTPAAEERGDHGAAASARPAADARSTSRRHEPARDPAAPPRPT